MSRCLLHPALPMPDEEIIERFRALSASLISDVFDRWSGAGDILPVAGCHPGEVVVGPAMTVRTRPGDNLVVHKALDLARPGEVVVIGAGGDVNRAILGGLMGHYAKQRGVAALVVDGAVRDRSDLERQSCPVFARGLCQLGPYKDGPGELRGAVAIGGLAVQDGDLIIGDEDGITAVPRARAVEILEAAEAKAKNEAQQDADIGNRKWDRSWVDQALEIVEVNSRAETKEQA